MQINRRKMITLMGGGVILAAGAGTFVNTRTPNEALAPWNLAGGYTEPRKRALSYAILAPNPHNRQPWVVDLSQQDLIVLHIDTDKMLPHTDPFNRQITVGLGGFLELLRMAAAEDGYHTEVEAFPQGVDPVKLDSRPIAIIAFKKDSQVQKDPLFKQVLERRSLKEPYDMTRLIPKTALARLNALQQPDVALASTNEPQLVDRIRKLTHTGLAIEIETPRAYKESVDLFRIGKAEINANPDGIDFSGATYESLAAAGLFNREVALDTSSISYLEGINSLMVSADTAVAYVWLTTETNTRVEQLNAGRDWLRINLLTTELGIGVHPMSQCLQEYSEMDKPFADMQQLLRAEGKTIQMLGRLGYAAPVPRSPRWSIEAKIIKA